jgi:hypothetical protein
VTAVSRLTFIACSAWLWSTAAACSDERATLVTVKVRPTVVGATSLVVELKNGAGTAGDRLELRGHTFPLTFTVSSPGRSGDLEIKVTAKNDADLLVGRGAATVPIAESAAEVLVDSADFVINTNVAEDQYLTDDFEAVGSQLSVNSSGEWLAAFRETCTAAACNVFARRFSRIGQPLSSAAAAGTNAFAANTGRIGVISTAAVASGADKTLLFWETTNATDLADGVACRPIDRAGTAGGERKIATEPGTDVVVATPLINGSYAVAWAGHTIATDPLNIRTLVVDGNCAPIGTQQIVGTLLPTVGLRQSAIAAGPTSYLIAWHADGAVRARTFTLAGAPSSADTPLVSPPVSEEYSMVRAAAYSGGYALVAAHRVGTVVSLELYRVGATGAPALLGPATLVTDKVDSIFDGFSVAAHPQGPILVSWHGCGVHGDGEGCGVFGRLFSTSGAALGDAFVIPTTTALDQFDASVAPLVAEDGQLLFVAAWNDLSATAPDTSGAAARARILYPPQP